MNPAINPLSLAERVVTLFAEGSFSSTYKHALLLGLIDLCFEKTSTAGVVPTSITTRELAENVLSLYWPQCVLWKSGQYLRQSGGTRQQAEILTRIIETRKKLGRSDSQSLFVVKRDSFGVFERLLHEVEWKLVEMPIPRLQRLGQVEDRFLYEYNWDVGIKQGQVSSYQRGHLSEFDNTLKLKSGVAKGLIALNGLLRPLIRREWLRLLQRFNGEPEQDLERFLFDRERNSLAPIRDPLAELQGGRCFFCDGRLSIKSEVDHFIPWSRFPTNVVENLVVAHDQCNRSKLDFLASAGHVTRWSNHLIRHRLDLESLGTMRAIGTAHDQTRGIAAATYLQLPEHALLWVRKDEFEPLRRSAIELALNVA